MSTQLDALHQRLAKLEAWKEKIAPSIGSGFERLEAFVAEAGKVLEVAKRELGDLGINVESKPAPTTEGEPKP